MSRIRRRVCLQDGPLLDLNMLAKLRIIRRGFRTKDRTVIWTYPYTDLKLLGLVSADLSKVDGTGWLTIQIGELFQEVSLVAQPRHFGGHQWYFRCPSTGHVVSVLFRPPGADNFASRYAWGDRVAYITQFGTRIDRAHLGKARIARRIGDCDPEKVTSLPRPKGMRSKTYVRLAARFAAYQSRLDDGLAKVVQGLNLADR